MRPTPLSISAFVFSAALFGAGCAKPAVPPVPASQAGAPTMVDVSNMTDEELEAQISKERTADEAAMKAEQARDEAELKQEEKDYAALDQQDQAEMKKDQLMQEPVQ